MILLHILFAPYDEIGGTNAMHIIKIGRTEKHYDQVSRLWYACRQNNKQPKTITIEGLAGCGEEQLTI